MAPKAQAGKLGKWRGNYNVRMCCGERCRTLEQTLTELPFRKSLFKCILHYFSKTKNNKTLRRLCHIPHYTYNILGLTQNGAVLALQPEFDSEESIRYCFVQLN